MGWDCTLHVVDDTQLTRFAARFVRGLHRGGAFDREFDGDELITNVKQLIADDPETGARALGELALLYVATEMPHLYCRGFALSLWDPAVMGTELPTHLLTGVETRLLDVTAAYPRIAGRIPAQFDGNYCVGRYVAAKHVPALLAFVEPVIARQLEARPYRPLLDILRVAAANNLAYWEGADIDVTNAHAEWLPARPSPVITHPNPFTSPTARPCAIEGARMLVADHVALHELDLSMFPPGTITHDDMQINAAAFTPWGTTFVRMATDRTVRPFKFAYFELPERAPLEIDPPFAIGLARPGKNCLLLFPQPTTTERANLRPQIMYADHRLVPLVVPDPIETQRVECDAIPFGTGEMLVVWDAVAYRWDGESAPTMLGETLDAPEDLCAVTLSDGSIVGGFGRKLLRVDREGHSTPVLPLDNVIMLAKGPHDAVIIGESEGDAFKIWWPETREVTALPLALLGLEERPMFAYYDAHEELLVVARPGTWHAIAWSELVALRREPA